MTRKLIDSDRLAVLLDGLDELPETLRGPALEALSTQATFRFLVLSRSKQMVAAVSRGPLVGAAALELERIPASVAADYLTRTQCDPLPGEWQRLADYLHTYPKAAVSRALNSPLMVTLVRDAYRDGGNPAELLHPSKLGMPMEDHLLDRVLRAAYTPRGKAAPRYSLDVATRGLKYIAARMNQDHTRDLAWWRCRAGYPPHPG